MSWGLESLGRLDSSVVTIGNFDGLHRGHQSLVENICGLSQKLSCPSVVVSFSPHPKQLLAPQQKFEKLYDFDDLRDRLGAFGVDHLVIESFTEEYAKLSKQEFFESRILPFLSPKALVLGHDFRFGRGAEGDFSHLESLSLKHDFVLEKKSAVSMDNEILSTTLIKERLKEGQVDWAQRALGRPYHLKGKVVPGEGRGKGLGFPTLNIDWDIGVLPKVGVYMTEVKWGEQNLPSVCNIGYNPTFAGEKKIKLEVHILDRDLDLYGQEVEVSFLKSLREEKKFQSVEQLKKQIGEDVGATRQYFQSI